MIREFLFKVLIWMYNRYLFLGKQNKMTSKFYINNKVAKKILKSIN